MNKKILFIICLGILAGLLIIYILCKSCGIYSPFKKINPKISVAILVISVSKSKIESNPRWQIEKENWLYKYKYPTWADVFLIECDTIKENFAQVSKYKCVESGTRGIFQKTILAIENLLSHKYDYYVRTNLSTFIIYDRLYKYLDNIGIVNEPIYRGVYCADGNWVGGFGIILNRPAAKKLVEIGKKPKFFNKKTSDDVLVGKIMTIIDCKCVKNEILYYQWIYNKSNNLKNIENNDKIFIRLFWDMKTNRKAYSNAVVRLVDKFSKY